MFWDVVMSIIKLFISTLSLLLLTHRAMAGALIREDDKRVYGDAGYTGMWKHLGEEKDAPDSWCCVAAKRGTIKKMDDSPMKTLRLEFEKAKASIRAKVEHPFHVIKNLFGYRKVRYKGLAKNQVQLFTLFALGNLVLATRCEGRVDGGQCALNLPCQPDSPAGRANIPAEVVGK